MQTLPEEECWHSRQPLGPTTDGRYICWQPTEPQPRSVPAQWAETRLEGLLSFWWLFAGRFSKRSRVLHSHLFLDNLAMKGNLGAAGDSNLLKTIPLPVPQKGLNISIHLRAAWARQRTGNSAASVCGFSTAGTHVYFFYNKATCPRSQLPEFFILQPHQEKQYQSSSTDARQSWADPQLVKTVMYLKSAKSILKPISLHINTQKLPAPHLLFFP